MPGKPPNTRTARRRAAVRATMPAGKVAAMTDASEDITEAENDQRETEAIAEATQAAAAAAAAQPMLFVMPGNQMLLEPTSVQGPDGQPLPVVRITVRNPIGGSTCILAAAALDEHITRCQELRSAMQGTGLYTLPAPTLIVAPPGAHA